MSIKPIILTLALLLSPALIYGQPNTPCSTATYNPVLANATGTILYICTTNNTWITVPVTPSGSIVMITSGTCSAGWTEATELNGKTLVGTVAANNNVGTTGGSDSITPTGTVTAPTFTGTVNTLAVTAHTVVATKQGTASGNVVTTATHTITGIPGGTNSIPVFSGAAFDNHPTFTRVIFCKKS
jgi:hypothetical protein